MARIEVEPLGEEADDPLRFRVRVHEDDGYSDHTVTMEQATYQRLAEDGATPEHVLEAAFAFLLDREPKESVLASFDVTVISRYFPGFEDELPKYL